jgi:hypothetical protein
LESISIAQLGQQRIPHSSQCWARRGSACSSPHSQVDMGILSQAGAGPAAAARMSPVAGISSRVRAQAAQ